MSADVPYRSGGQQEPYVQGWLISVFLHGVVALAALLTVKHIQLAPQDEAFKWNVAMVSLSQSVQPTVPSRKQAPARSPSTTSAPSPRAQRTTPAQAFSSPQPIAQQTTPSIYERARTPVMTEPPPPQLPTTSQSAAPTTQPAESFRHETVPPMVDESTSILKPADATTADSDARPVPSSAPAAILGQTLQSDPNQALTQMAAISPAPLTASTKRDYGWLSEMILRRVEELKRYPASARLDRAEGKVVVKAVIDEHGDVGEVEVYQSSGHPGLDKAAIETLRQAAPFHLSHPLGQPHMTVKIPMSYRLDR